MGYVFRRFGGERGFVNEDACVARAGEADVESAAGVGEGFPHFFAVGFDEVIARRAEADDKDVRVVGGGVNGEGGADDGGRAEVVDGGRGAGAGFQRGDGAIGEQLGASVEEAEPGRIVFPGATDKESSGFRVVEDEWKVHVAQAGLVGVGPEKFVGCAEGAAEHVAIHDEPALEVLAGSSVIVEGDEREAGGAGECGGVEVGFASARIHWDAIFIFGGGVGSGIVARDVEGGEVVEPGGAVLAEVDGEVVADGVEDFDQRVEGAADGSFGIGSKGGCVMAAPPLGDGIAEDFRGEIGIFGSDGDGGEDAVAPGGEVGGRRRSCEGVAEAGFELSALGGSERVLAPIEDEGERAKVRFGSGGRGDGLGGGGAVLGDFVVESPRESWLRHCGATGHEAVQLLPAHGLALALAAEKAESLLGEEEARVVGVDVEAFLIGGEGGRAEKAEKTEGGEGSQTVFYCPIADLPERSGMKNVRCATSLNRVVSGGHTGWAR